MVALMFMQFGIGLDLGRVLTKAIIISLLTVFLLMPALIVMFSGAIDKTVHKNFVPTINFWGKLVVKLRFLGVPLFLAIVAAASRYAGKCPYIYDINSIESSKKNEFMASKARIEETFEVTNTMAIVVPRGDYEKEGKILKRLENMEEVDMALGLANVEVSDDGNAWRTLERVERECSNGYYEYPDGVTARYVRITGSALPYGQPLRISGLRVFGKGDGEKPAPARASAVRLDDLDARIAWEPIPGAQGCNVRYGVAPDKLYHSWLVYGVNEVTLSTLIKGQRYFVRVDSFNENGITPGEVIEVV